MVTRDEIDELRESIKTEEEQLRLDKERLASIERRCRHEWSPVTADHVHHKAYTTPGDPPGTMGVDWRGPCHVDAKTEYRWKRTCSRCGKVEHTSRTEDRVEKVVKVPVF
jgi:hypothetical protein